MNRAELVYQRSPAWLQNVFLNAHAYRISRHRYGKEYWRAVGDLMEQERWDVQRIEDFQVRKLRAVLAYAYEKSSHYRRVMDEVGIEPTDVERVSDLRRLPLLTKETVRNKASELLTEPRPKPDWLHGHTSGTTGSPLGLWYDRTTCVINNAVDRQHKTWAGMGKDDWIGLLLGRVVVPTDRDRPPFWRVNFLHRQVWFSSFHLSEDHLGSYVREIERRRLRFLEGYPSTLYILAKYLIARGRTLPMKAVITSSETLHALQREAIERAFECPLYDFYALAERVIYAGECNQHQGKHLAETYGITEIVDDAGEPVPDGQTGYLVGTSLFNTATPMIRYRTTDVSAFVTEPCDCGRTMRRIRDVSTKAEDIIVTPDGRQISPSILTHPFKPLEQIAASQIVQDRRDHLLVKLVPTREFSQEHESQLVASLQQRVGFDVEIEVRLVSDIPRERSGKFRWVISNVDHSCSLNWDEATEPR